MTNSKKTVGIHELYQRDLEEADEKLWGRKVDPITRRGFLHNSGLAAMATFLGSSIPFASNMPSGLIPIAMANSVEAFVIEGKEGLRVLNDRPINAETPPHFLDDTLTPAKYFFVRNNGIAPDPESIGKPEQWTLEIGGEAATQAKSYTLKELQEKFTHHSYALTLECGGNGRSEFDPPAKGNQWSTGAVGCAKWTGVRLRDVLEDCGIADNAVYIGYYGADSHLSGDPARDSISRGVPLNKAMEDESLIAWKFNDEDIPHHNGHPLRLVIGGWPASTSGKWLKKIVLRDKVHDGAKMAAPSYSVPCEPVAPGSEVTGDQMCIIGSMPIKSLVTFPKSGVVHSLKKTFSCRGKAWAGDLHVAGVEVSIDFGATWLPATLDKAPNRLAWQQWRSNLTFPEPGYYEVWAKATDANGRAQPMLVPGWNPKGYLNNACHRIAVQVV